MNLEPETPFSSMWKFCKHRGDCMVQTYSELEYVYGLMRSCNAQSYLEIGTAEGDTLYILGSTVANTGRIHWIDKNEPLCRDKRIQIEGLLKPRKITGYAGLSTDASADLDEMFDVVLIDGAHDYETVLSDSRRFAPLARKYVFWHDVQIEEVKRAVHDYLQDHRRGNYSEFIDSTGMGFGILEIDR